MKARLIVACVCVALLVAGGSWAGEIVEASGGGAPPVVAAVAVAGAVGNPGPIKARIHPSTPERVSARLEAGFELAVERVREVESCGDLFTQLGADAVETLATGLYFPVDSHHREVEVCGRNSATSSTGAKNLAYTDVGPRRPGSAVTSRGSRTRPPRSR